MSSLQFNKIIICSESEQAAVELSFHPRRNLLWGPNGSGKSAVLKSVFRALDAEPKGLLPGWDYGAIVVLDFSVLGRQLTSVRRRDLRALYDRDRLLGVATSSSQWNEIFAKEVGFNLKLVDRGGNFRAAAPANYFLPFFINQDGSFQSSWDTFEGLKQFQSAPQQTLEYFSRVRPLRYFELKAQHHNIKQKDAELRVELSTLQRTRERVKRNFKAIPVKLNDKEFQLEIRELILQLSNLSSAQDKLRKNLVEDQDALHSLMEQVRLSNAALKEHDADFKFAAESSAQDSKFVCPTCHAEHDDSFHTFLELSEDARELAQLKLQLEDLVFTAKSRLARNRIKATGLKVEYLQLQSLLAIKRGRHTFDDFVKSRGAFAADTQLAAEEDTVKKELGEKSAELVSIASELKQLKTTHDSEGPVKTFRDNFTRAIVTLDVPSPENIEKWPLAKRPKTSGSRHARTIIAYYSALWNTITTGNNPLPSPLVIDSPNQGAQDNPHLQQLLTSIAAQAPVDAQVILAHEEQPKEFEADKVLEFSSNTSLLTKESFTALFPSAFWYVEDALRKLGSINSIPSDQHNLDLSDEYADLEDSE
jgi:hypothetical protein